MTRQEIKCLESIKRLLAEAVQEKDIALKDATINNASQIVVGMLFESEYVPAMQRAHTCVVCGVNPVDTDAGYDTCAACLRRI